MSKKRVWSLAFIVFLPLKVKAWSFLFSPKRAYCREFLQGKKKKREDKYILEGWHNFLLKTSSNVEFPGKIFQFDFPVCESNQKLLSRFNLLMRSSDWKLVIPLSVRLTISILLSASFHVWKYLCGEVSL